MIILHTNFFPIFSKTSWSFNQKFFQAQDMEDLDLEEAPFDMDESIGNNLFYAHLKSYPSPTFFKESGLQHLHHLLRVQSDHHLLRCMVLLHTSCNMVVRRCPMRQTRISLQRENLTSWRVPECLPPRVLQ